MKDALLNIEAGLRQAFICASARDIAGAKRMIKEAQGAILKLAQIEEDRERLNLANYTKRKQQVNTPTAGEVKR